MKEHNLPLSFLRSGLRSLGIQASRISPYTNDKAAVTAMLDHAGVDLLFDVGANIGQYAKERFANGYKGKIVSFEPLSAARGILKKEMAAFPNWALAEQCALGAAEGTVTMHISENSQASSILAATSEHLAYAPKAVEVGNEVVRLERLDRVAASYIGEARKPFLKIDVQGFEEQVLLGASEIIPKLVGLQLELSLVSMYKNQKLFPEMLAFISGMGFTLYRMIPAWIDQQTGRWLQADGIFYR